MVFVLLYTTHATQTETLDFTETGTTARPGLQAQTPFPWTIGFDLQQFSNPPTIACPSAHTTLTYLDKNQPKNCNALRGQQKDKI